MDTIIRSSADLADDAFDDPEHLLKDDWRSHVPMDVRRAWRSLSRDERYTALIQADIAREGFLARVSTAAPWHEDRPVPAPDARGSQRLLTAMRVLYKFEINTGIESDWDGGFSVYLGNKYSGRSLEQFGIDLLEPDAAARWLLEHGRKLVLEELLEIFDHDCAAVFAEAEEQSEPRSDRPDAGVQKPSVQPDGLDL